MDANLAARAEREREYWNNWVGEERPQSKFYFATEAARTDFVDKVRAAASGQDALEVCCGTGANCYRVASAVKSITGLDISDKRVQEAQKKADESPFSNIKFVNGDAQNPPFPDQSFDTIFGAGALHHIDLNAISAGMSRLLRPGGKAIFIEPLAHNPIFEGYRRLTPADRSKDERALFKSDLDIVGKHLKLVDATFFGLTTLAAVPFQRLSFGKSLRGGLKVFDDALFKLPGMKWMAWQVVLIFEKNR